jgi:hypothetical protein
MGFASGWCVRNRATLASSKKQTGGEQASVILQLTTINQTMTPTFGVLIVFFSIQKSRSPQLLSAQRLRQVAAETGYGKGKAGVPGSG